METILSLLLLSNTYTSILINTKMLKSSIGYL